MIALVLSPEFILLGAITGLVYALLAAGPRAHLPQHGRHQLRLRRARRAVRRRPGEAGDRPALELLRRARRRASCSARCSAAPIELVDRASAVPLAAAGAPGRHHRRVAAAASSAQLLLPLRDERRPLPVALRPGGVRRRLPAHRASTSSCSPSCPRSWRCSPCSSPARRKASPSAPPPTTPMPPSSPASAPSGSRRSCGCIGGALAALTVVIYNPIRGVLAGIPQPALGPGPAAAGARRRADRPAGLASVGARRRHRHRRRRGPAVRQRRQQGRRRRRAVRARPGAAARRGGRGTAGLPSSDGFVPTPRPKPVPGRPRRPPAGPAGAAGSALGVPLAAAVAAAVRLHAAPTRSSCSAGC